MDARLQNGSEGIACSFCPEELILNECNFPWAGLLKILTILRTTVGRPSFRPGHQNSGPTTEARDCKRSVGWSGRPKYFSR